jgi:hypothetical protein
MIPKVVLDTLEKRIYREIREFPERIDEMETRRDDACRRLAARIIGVIEDATVEASPPLPPHSSR